jgi:hypothetical protein
MEKSKKPSNSLDYYGDPVEENDMADKRSAHVKDADVQLKS